MTVGLFFVTSMVVGAMAGFTLACIILRGTVEQSADAEARAYAERNGDPYPYDDVGMRVPIDKYEDR